MALQIGDTLGSGVRRAFTFSGGVLMALMFGYMVLFTSATNTLFLEILPEEVQETGQFGLALPVSPAVAGGIMTVGLFFGVVLYLVAARALSRDHRELSTFPSELFTRRIGRATLSAIGASIIIQIAVSIGLVLLVVPGIFLAISFLFAVFAIGVEDRRAIDSLKRSWGLASGNRWRLFALVVIVAVATGLLSSIGSLASIVDPIAGQVLSLAITAILSVVIYGVIADAFLRLREDDTGGSDGAETAGTVTPAA